MQSIWFTAITAGAASLPTQGNEGNARNGCTRGRGLSAVLLLPARNLRWCCRPPDPRRAIVLDGNNPPTVVCKSDRPDRAVVPWEIEHSSTGFNIPQLGCTITTPSENPLAIRRNGHRQHVAFMSVEHERFSASGC